MTEGRTSAYGVQAPKVSAIGGDGDRGGGGGGEGDGGGGECDGAPGHVIFTLYAPDLVDQPSITSL